MLNRAGFILFMDGRQLVNLTHMHINAHAHIDAFFLHLNPAS